MGLAFLWIARILIGGAILAIILAVLRSILFGGDIRPGDEEKPFYQQWTRIGFYNSYYAPRWHTWAGVAATILPIPLLGILFKFFD